MDFETLSQWLIDYAASYPEEYNQINIWRKPMMACAKADNRFLRLREIRPLQPAGVMNWQMAKRRTVGSV
ncbi:MAG: hypothetical protein K9N21_10470 [Deltaproteobacteria bacterium]|nr:hypothetical protein [Deltaproteobacteria bacterium]